jgi:hypothetical protein
VEDSFWNFRRSDRDLELQLVFAFLHCSKINYSLTLAIQVEYLAHSDSDSCPLVRCFWLGGRMGLGVGSKESYEPDFQIYQYAKGVGLCFSPSSNIAIAIDQAFYRVGC